MDYKLKSNWNAIKGELKQKYGELTDDDLTYIEGKEDVLIAKLQKALSKSKDQITQMLKKMSDQVDVN